METYNIKFDLYNITFDSDQYENKVDYCSDYYSSYSYTWAIDLFDIYLNKNLKIKNHHKLLINICYLLNKYTEVE